MPSHEVIDRFTGLRALVVGDAMLDSYLEGTATRLCREGPVPVVKREWEQHVPGGAANSAANLHALGASVRFVALTGTDDAAAMLRAVLRERGIAEGEIASDERARTLRKLRIVANGQYVVRFDEGDLTTCSELSRRRVVASFDDAIGHCDVAIVSDYGYGTVSDAIVERLRHRSFQGVLVVDAKDPRRFYGTHPTALTPNQQEIERAAEMAGVGTDGELLIAKLEHAGEALRSRTGARAVVVTLAERGALVVTASGSEHVACRPVDNAGGIGAGDSFTAAFALALGAGAELASAARLGNAAAAIAVGKRRTAVTSIDELRAATSDASTAPRVVTDDDGLRALAASLVVQRSSGRTVVFTNGVFDILHAGHVDILRRARELGDVLVVGVNTDDSVRRLKGPDRPVNSELDRAETLAALDHVDHVVLFRDDTPARLIRAIRPDLHVKGDDYRPETVPEADAVREVGARIVIVPRVGGLSTTNVIRRIASLSARAS